MTPQKYPQNIHTQKIFICLKPRKKPELQNFEPKKKIPAPTYVCKYQSTPPPPPPPGDSLQKYDTKYHYFFKL